MREAKTSPYPNLVFFDGLQSEASTRKKKGVPTAITYVNGVASFNGSSSKVVYPTTKLKSIRIKINSLNSTTQHICKLTSTHSISVSSGTISATGFSSPTIYVNGVVTSTITTAGGEIVITTATQITANAFNLGYITSYLNGTVESISCYSSVLTASEVANLYKNNWYKELAVLNGSISNSNLATNGTFDNATGWTLGAGWGISNGVLSKSNTGTNTYCAYNINALEGRKYKLTFTITNYVSGVLGFYIGNSSSVKVNYSSAGTFEETLYCLGNSNIYIYGFTTFAGSIDNLTVYEYSPSLLFDLNTSNGLLKETTGKTLTATDVTFKKIGYNSTAVFDQSKLGLSKIDCGSDFIGVKAFTLTGWIYAKTLGENSASSIIDNGKILFRLASVNKLSFYSDASTNYTSAANSIPFSKWIFISVTRKSDGKITFYIGSKNTAPVISGSAYQNSGIPVAGTSNVIVGNNTGQTRTFNGSIQQLKVYEGILDLATITSIWSETRKDVK